MAFDPNFYFDPEQVARALNGEFGPIDMKPFTYPNQRPMWIEPVWGHRAAPESEKEIVLEKTFILALCLGFVTALVLSFGLSPLAAVLGGLVPVALWLAIMVLRLGKRMIWWLARNVWRIVKRSWWWARSGWWYAKKTTAEYRARRALAQAKVILTAKAAEQARRRRALSAVDASQRMTVEQAKSSSPQRQAMEKRVLERITGTGPKDKGQMGLPYVSEDDRLDDPDSVGDGIGWDCSSLMNFAWAPEGVDFKDCNAQMEFDRQRADHRILPEPAMEYLRPGDLLFFVNRDGEVKHVGMFVKKHGNFVTMVEANHEDHLDGKPSGVVKSPYVRVGADHPNWGSEEFYLCASRPGKL